MAQTQRKLTKEVEEARAWDRKCLVCGSVCMMENPEVYDMEVFECQNQKCRAQFTIKTYYDRGGHFIKEEFLGKTMEALNG